MVIGDPMVRGSFFFSHSLLAFERARDDAVMVICADVSDMCLLLAVLQDKNVLVQENMRRTSSRTSGLQVEVSLSRFAVSCTFHTFPAITFGTGNVCSTFHRLPLGCLHDVPSAAPIMSPAGIPSTCGQSL